MILELGSYQINLKSRMYCSSHDSNQYTVLHRDRYQVTRALDAPQLELLEYDVWITGIRNKPLTIAVVYHPPLEVLGTLIRFLSQIVNIYLQITII